MAGADPVRRGTVRKDIKVKLLHVDASILGDQSASRKGNEP